MDTLVGVVLLYSWKSRFIKNWITGWCNSRVSIGPEIMVNEPGMLYKYGQRTRKCLAAYFIFFRIKTRKKRRLSLVFIQKRVSKKLLITQSFHYLFIFFLYLVVVFNYDNYSTHASWREKINLKFREIVQTELKFHHQFHFTSTFKCFIPSSTFVFDVWCS